MYADLVSAPVQGHLLTYTTRYFPPVKRCLKFVYHMNGHGVGYLAVQLLQGIHLSEIFRIVGSQESGWNNASVPLSDVDATGPQFRVSFFAC